MWPKQVDLLTPLSNKPGKEKFFWTSEMNNAFKIMKMILASNVLMIHPNHNIPFDIYTDASSYQTGAVIIQQKQSGAY